MRAIIVPVLLTYKASMYKPKPITCNNNKLTGDIVFVLLSVIVRNMYSIIAVILYK